MTTNYKIQNFVGKNITLDLIGHGSTAAKTEGVLVEYNEFGVLLEGTSKTVMFYPWRSIFSIDVTQAYGQLKVA